MQHSELDAVELVKAAMEITADICIFTNHHFTVESVSEPVTEDAVADVTATTGETEPEPEPEKPKSRSRKKGGEG
jgi:hypothetical protein